MTITTLRPTSDSVNTFTLTGGASAHAVTSDNSDASYANAIYPGYSELIVGFSGFTLPAGTYIKQVRMRIRYATLAPGAITLWYARLIDPQGNASTLDTYQTIQGTPIEGQGGWRPLNPQGNSWSAADINALRVDVYPGLWTGNVQMPIIYEVYLDVETNTNPTTTITSPANGGSVTTSTRPPTVFTYADVDNDPIDAYRVMVFSSTQYSAVGFDPNTATTAVYDSGKVSTQFLPTGGVAPNVDLSNLVTYRSYVWVYQFGATGGRTGNGVSTPAMSQYSINVTPPAIPTITATASTVFGVQFIAVDIAAGSGGAATATINIERSTDNGNTWIVAFTGGSGVQFQDLLFVPSTPTLYRARAYTAGGIAGAYSANVSATVNDTEWRIRDRDNPLTNTMKLNILGASVKTQHPEDKAFFSPLGRARKVAVSDVLKGSESTLQVEFLTDDDYHLFMALRALQKTLWLTRGWTGEGWWIQFTEQGEEELFNYSPTYRTFTIGWIEVDAPNQPATASPTIIFV